MRCGSRLPAVWPGSGHVPTEETPGWALLCHALGLGWSWALSALDPGGEAGLLETWGEGQLKKIPERKNGARLGGTEDARLGLPEGVSAREGVRRGPGGRARAGPAQRASSLGLCSSFPQPPPGRGAAGASSPWGSPCLAPPATCLWAAPWP